MAAGDTPAASTLTVPTPGLVKLTGSPLAKGLGEAPFNQFVLLAVVFQFVLPGFQVRLLPVTGVPDQLSLKLSMPKVSRLPEPVLADKATTRIHTFWFWLSRAVPKLKARFVLPKTPGSVKVIPTVVNVLGVAPKP